MSSVSQFGSLDSTLVGDDGTERNGFKGSWIDIAVDVLMQNADRVVGWYLLGNAMNRTTRLVKLTHVDAIERIARIAFLECHDIGAVPSFCWHTIVTHW